MAFESGGALSRIGEGDGSTDCEPIVRDVCTTGSFRSARGLCVRVTGAGAATCTAHCATGAGFFDMRVGACSCALSASAVACDASCIALQPTAAVDAQGNLNIVLSRGSPANQPLSVTLSPRHIVGFTGRLSTCNDRTSGAACALVTISITEGKFQGSFSVPRAVLEVALTTIASEASARRLSEATVPFIAQPIVCISAGDGLLFEIASGGDYPVYVVGSLLNSNPIFDYSAFRELGRDIAVAAISNVSTLTPMIFSFTFDDAGVYDFASASDASAMLVVVVLASGVACPAGPAIAPFTTGLLVRLGVRLTDSRIKGFDFRVVVGLSASAAILFLTTLSAIAMLSHVPSVARTVSLRTSRKSYVHGGGCADLIVADLERLITTSTPQAISRHVPVATGDVARLHALRCGMRSDTKLVRAAPRPPPLFAALLVPQPKELIRPTAFRMRVCPCLRSRAPRISALSLGAQVASSYRKVNTSAPLTACDPTISTRAQRSQQVVAALFDVQAQIISLQDSTARNRAMAQSHTAAERRAVLSQAVTADLRARALYDRKLTKAESNTLHALVELSEALVRGSEALAAETIAEMKVGNVVGALGHLIASSAPGFIYNRTLSVLHALESLATSIVTERQRRDATTPMWRVCGELAALGADASFLAPLEVLAETESTLDGNVARLVQALQPFGTKAPELLKDLIGAVSAYATRFQVLSVRLPRRESGRIIDDDCATDDDERAAPRRFRAIFGEIARLASVLSLLLPGLRDAADTARNIANIQREVLLQVEASSTVPNEAGSIAADGAAALSPGVAGADPGAGVISALVSELETVMRSRASGPRRRRFQVRAHVAGDVHIQSHDRMRVSSNAGALVAALEHEQQQQQMHDKCHMPEQGRIVTAQSAISNDSITPALYLTPQVARILASGEAAAVSALDASLASDVELGRPRDVKEWLKYSEAIEERRLAAAVPTSGADVEVSARLAADVFAILKATDDRRLEKSADSNDSEASTLAERHARELVEFDAVATSTATEELAAATAILEADSASRMKALRPPLEVVRRSAGDDVTSLERITRDYEFDVACLSETVAAERGRQMARTQMMISARRAVACRALCERQELEISAAAELYATRTGEAAAKRERVAMAAVSQQQTNAEAPTVCRVLSVPRWTC